MTVKELMNKLKDLPENCEVVTHIKVKDRKYIVVPVEGVSFDVSGVVGIEGKRTGGRNEKQNNSKRICKKMKSDIFTKNTIKRVESL